MSSWLKTIVKKSKLNSLNSLHIDDFPFISVLRFRRPLSVEKLWAKPNYNIRSVAFGTRCILVIWWCCKSLFILVLTQSLWNFLELTVFQFLKMIQIFSCYDLSTLSITDITSEILREVLNYASVFSIKLTILIASALKCVKLKY